MIGGSFTAFTVNTKELLTVNPSTSRTVTVIVAEPNSLVAGRTVTVRLAPLPPRRMFAFGTSWRFDDAPVTTRPPAGVSTSPTVKEIALVGVSSLVTWLAMTEIEGAWFTGVTLTTKFVLLVPPVPSVTVSVIVVVPDCLASGVTVRARLVPVPPRRMFALGTSPGFEEKAVTARFAAGDSTSRTVKGSTPVAPPSSMVWFAGGEIRGRSFTGLTVRMKVRLAIPKLVSCTNTVMEAVPLWFVAGVMMIVRLLPLPPKTRFALGTRFVFDDRPDNVSSVAGVAESPTMNGIAGVGVSSAVIWLAMVDTVGMTLPAGQTKTVKARVTLSIPSLTVTATTAVPVPVLEGEARRTEPFVAPAA